jgi:hypothetical protein
VEVEKKVSYEIRDKRRMEASWGREMNYLICCGYADEGELSWETVSKFDNDDSYRELITDWERKYEKNRRSVCGGKGRERRTQREEIERERNKNVRECV